MQMSKVKRGKGKPTAICNTSVPDPPSTAPATHMEQVTFQLSLEKNASLGKDTSQVPLPSELGNLTKKIPTKKKSASALWKLLAVL